LHGFQVTSRHYLRPRSSAMCARTASTRSPTCLTISASRSVETPSALAQYCASEASPRLMRALSRPRLSRPTMLSLPPAACSSLPTRNGLHQRWVSPCTPPLPLRQSESKEHPTHLADQRN